MALEIKPLFIGFDKTGAILTLRDGTGVYSVNNPTGYGTPNLNAGDINSIVFTVSNFNTTDILRQTYVRVADPTHPEWLISPTINQITAGADVLFSSVTSEGMAFPVPFSAGVLDINMYVLTNTVKTGVVGQEGMSYIEGSDLDQYLVYDVIYANDKIYDIDKTKNTSGGTVLWLVQDLLEDITSFRLGYRGNTKAFNDKPLVDKLYNSAAKQAMCCGNDKCDIMLNLHRELAVISFEAGDYGTASNLLGKYNCC